MMLRSVSASASRVFDVLLNLKQSCSIARHHASWLRVRYSLLLLPLLLLRLNRRTVARVNLS